MNVFEKILLAFLGTAVTTAPIFVHSTHGTVVLNASESLLSNLLVQFAQPQPQSQAQTQAPASASAPIPVPAQPVPPQSAMDTAKVS